MSVLPLGFRRAVFQMHKPVFVCRQCLRQQKLPASLPSRIAQLARARSYATAPSRPSLSSVSSTIQSEGATASSGAYGASKKSFPDTSPRSVAYWLLGSAASVFGIVVFGGLTRLTESGYFPLVSHAPFLFQQAR